MNPNLTEDELIAYLDSKKYIEPNEIFKIVKHPNVSEKVFFKVINKINLKFDSLRNPIYLEIIKNKAVTPIVLKYIVSDIVSATILNEISKSQKADEDVFNAIILKITNDTLKFSIVDKSIIFENIINNPNAGVKTFHSIIKSHPNADNVIGIVNSKNVDLSILDEIYEIADEYSKPWSDRIKEAVENRKKQLKMTKVPVIINNNKDNNFNVELEDTVTERIKRNVEDGMSTMLWGLSGIGKTARVKEIDPTFTMIKLKNDMLPEEVTGGKEPNGEPGEMYPPRWYLKLCDKCKKEPERMHILFIDELTNVKDNVKSLVWDIIEDRRVNGDEDWELPDNCAIVAAGNRPEESTSVITDYNGGVLPEPLHDRFDFHIEIPLDMGEWQQWALETDKKTGNLNIHPIVLSFCVPRAEEVMFSNIDVEDITKPRLSPRRWAKLSKAIYMAEKRGGKKCHVSNQRIVECIGKDLAEAFIAHYEKEPIDMKKVEEGKYEAKDFENIDDKLYALSMIIAEYNGSENAVIDFIETCLGDDYVAVYNVMKNQRNTNSPKATKNSVKK